MKSRLRAEQLEARDNPSAGSTLVPIGVGVDYTLSVNTYGRVATMQLAATDWQKWQKGSITQADVQAMTTRLYQYFPDQFDKILFVNNLPDVDPASPYFGVTFGVKNQTTGIGESLYDDTALFGSAGRLATTIHLASERDLYTRTSLHEIQHLNGNFLPELQTTVPGHWGFASVGGQLGGWAPGTLTSVGTNLYNADGPNGRDYFYTAFADIEDGDIPYSQLELYLQGLIDASQVDPIQYATGPKFTNQATGEFSATGIQTLTYQNIIAKEGLRTPGPATSQKDFRVLTVVMTPNPLTQAELDQFDTDVELFGKKGSDGNPAILNYYEATGGRATLTMDGLNAYLPSHSPVLAVGAGSGQLLSFNTATTVAGQTGTRYNPTFTQPNLSALLAGTTGTVRSAVGDVNGDGIPDYIVTTGPGDGPTRFAVVSGDQSRYIVPPTFPFAGSESFTGGAYVSAGDLTGDGRADIVVSADQGGGPRVVVYSLNSISGLYTVANFFGIADPAFRGGARTAVGDVNRDGTPDLAVAAGFGGGPRVSVYDGTTLTTSRGKLVNDFFAFDNVLRDGAYLAIGDTNGDGYGDLVFGAGDGGAPRVLVVSGQKLLGGVTGALAAPLSSFFVGGDTTSRGGVRVATKDVDGDLKTDLIVGSGTGSASRLRVYFGANLSTGRGEPAVYQDLDPFGGATLTDGLYVG